jgi:hypothetical protein
MNINVHVERLILDGLPVTSSQGSLVRAAVEAGLIRLLAEQGLRRSSTGAEPHVSAGSIQLMEDSKPAQLGHQIARAIYGTLTPGPALTREIDFSGAPHR